MIEQVVRYGVVFVGLVAIVLVYYGSKKIEGISDSISEKEKYYFYCLPVAVLITAVYMIIKYTPEYDQFMAWKRIAFLPLLWYISYIDYKLKLILNEFLLMGIGLRGILLIPEILIGRRESLAVLVTELAGALILFLFGVLFRFLSRNGLGAGDVKLFALVPLFMGALEGLHAILLGMIIIFILSCVFLVLKRKGLKDELPFAPSIALGCWLIMFFSCV